MSKDLYIAEHERLTALAEDAGMSWQDAYEETADAAWDSMRDRMADMVDAAREGRTDEQHGDQFDGVEA